MPITWKPTRGSGYWRNGILIGTGEYINENECFIQKGTFDSTGKLSSAGCTFVDYSDSANVVVKVGEFSENKECGTIVEYVFSKSNFDDFIEGNPVTATKYRQSYTNGVWSSTISTTNNKPVYAVASKCESRIDGFSCVEESS